MDNEQLNSEADNNTIRRCKVYCARCDERTDTDNLEVLDIEINRLKKSGEINIQPRKVITGKCVECGKNKRVLANADGNVLNTKPLKHRRNNKRLDEGSTI